MVPTEKGESGVGWWSRRTNARSLSLDFENADVSENAILTHACHGLNCALVFTLDAMYLWTHVLMFHTTSFLINVMFYNFVLFFTLVQCVYV